MYLKRLRNYTNNCRYTVKPFGEITVSLFHIKSKILGRGLLYKPSFALSGGFISSLCWMLESHGFFIKQRVCCDSFIVKLPLFLWKIETPTNNVFSSYLLIRKLIEMHMCPYNILIKSNCGKSTKGKQTCKLV